MTDSIRLFRTPAGSLAEVSGKSYRFSQPSWDEILTGEHPREGILERVKDLRPESPADPDRLDLLPPIGGQEVWAAGVTYYDSRRARMEESAAHKGADFYDRVYSAERPELFFKATPHRVVGHGQRVRIRRDSGWNVPEPELTLAINPRGRIVGYTIGNDMSSREIEGENPLYLPQAKVYAQSCALGPGILLQEDPLPRSTRIEMEIRRGGGSIFQASTSLTELKRSPAELVEFLFRDNSFPLGCFLMTGTGIIPPSTFALEPGDEVRITIEPIGTLVNTVERSIGL